MRCTASTSPSYRRLAGDTRSRRPRCRRLKRRYARISPSIKRSAPRRRRCVVRGRARGIRLAEHDTRLDRAGERRLEKRRDDYSQQIAALKGLIPGTVEGRQAIMIARAPIVAPIVATQSLISDLPGARTRRVELASIIAAVFLILAYIAVSIIRPVRRLAARTRQLQELAEQDPLTGLPNRRELFHAAPTRRSNVRSPTAPTSACSSSTSTISNTSTTRWGTRSAIGCSSSFAQRLQATTTFGVAARLGGDEFTVVIDGARSNDDIRAAGSDIVQAFQKPLTVDNRDLVVSVSVGASIFPEHAKTSEALLKAADAALFRAKVMGRSQLSVFTPELLEAAAAQVHDRARVAPRDRPRRVRTILPARDQRRNSGDRDRRGLDPLAHAGRHVRHTGPVPRDRRRIRSDHGNQRLGPAIGDRGRRALAPRRVAAGARIDQCHSAATVRRRVSSDRLRELLRVHRLPARCIEIELTESVLRPVRRQSTRSKRLRAHGVAIALDDFGTGYSSFASPRAAAADAHQARSQPDRRDRQQPPLGCHRSRDRRDVPGARFARSITAEGIVERPEQFAAVRARELVLQSESDTSNVIDLSRPALRLRSDGK